MDKYDITPVEKIGGIYFKREDLYTPYEPDGVNGGKLRQCQFLIEKNLDKAKNGVFTVGDKTSPQQAIVAAVCRDLELPCYIYSSAKEYSPIMKLAQYYGANYVYNRGIPNGLAQGDAKRANGFFVKYGINLKDNKSALLEAVQKQVINVPDQIKRVFITCGSGITSSGVILGLAMYHKNVTDIYLIGNPHTRQDTVEGLIRPARLFYPELLRMNIHYLSCEMPYKSRVESTYEGIEFHPNYEGKMWKYVTEHYTLGEDDLVWIVGKEPKLFL